MLENARLQSLLDEANKKISSTKNKRADALAAHQVSQAKARESSKALVKLQGLADTQAKQLSIKEEETKVIVQEVTEKESRRHQVSFAFIIYYLYFIS